MRKEEEEEAYQSVGGYFPLSVPFPPVLAVRKDSEYSTENKRDAK